VRAIELKVDHFAGRIRITPNSKTKLHPRFILKSKEIYDPVLSFQLSNDFSRIACTAKLFIRDAESLEFAVLLEWNNIYYDDSQN
jgi:hypothetical protein